MLQNKIIQPLASSLSLDPKMSSLQPDKLTMPTVRKPWETEYCTVLVQNYGAADTIGALIVCQQSSNVKTLKEPGLLFRFPASLQFPPTTSLLAWYYKSLQKNVARLVAESSSHAFCISGTDDYEIYV
ncbi:hypothetical protein GJ744_004507 [Endocarpon pusillum]|uniref:Uncharacterized protein n=1 Tax=Endocarpon pusillum TaxID=364733 RepID=A0A8H7E9H4_9EURO|nr:hypothetical protein GJ744_004507 [Endocarpon pusillum]